MVPGSGNSYTAQIPANMVTGSGVDYYLSAWDSNGIRADSGNATTPYFINAGGCRLIGTPAAANVGTHIVVLGVSDGTSETLQTFTIIVTNRVPPVITSLPQSQTVLGGTTVAFSVTASGSAPLAYQWRWNGTNINGATAPTLSLSSVQPANAGAYSVVVTNLAGAVTSTPPAMLNVVTFAATHSGTAYQSPGTCVVSCQVSHAIDRSLYFLVYQPTLPAGWTLVSASGDGGAKVDSGQVVFPGSMPNPLNFTHTMSVPTGQAGTKQIAGDLLYYLSGMTATAYMPANPDPLVVNYGALLSLRLQGSKVQLTLQGDAARSYLIQSSSNLVNWSDVGAMIAVGGSVQTNQPLTGPVRFCRAKAQ